MHFELLLVLIFATQPFVRFTTFKKLVFERQNHNFDNFEIDIESEQIANTSVS